MIITVSLRKFNFFLAKLLQAIGLGLSVLGSQITGSFLG
jgi:hypothetical protein